MMIRLHFIEKADGLSIRENSSFMHCLQTLMLIYLKHGAVGPIQKVDTVEGDVS